MPVPAPPGDVPQQTWDAFDQLYFISDRSGWYNIYREGFFGVSAKNSFVSDQHADEGEVVAVKEMEAEFAGPMWKLGET